MNRVMIQKVFGDRNLVKFKILKQWKKEWEDTPPIDKAFVWFNIYAMIFTSILIIIFMILDKLGVVIE